MTNSLYTLPRNWYWSTIADVSDIESNLVDPTKFPNEPHIAPNHIESQKGSLLEYQTVFRDGVKSPKHLFYPGQILYSKIRPYLAKAVLVDFSGLCSADMYPIKAHINASYLHRWMISETFTLLASQHQGRTVLPKINQTALNKVSVPVPPLNEQRRIVTKIEELTAHSKRAREALEDIPALIEQFKQSVLAAAFRGDLTADWREKNPDVEPASKLLERIREDRRVQWEAAELEKMRAKGKEPKNDKWKDKYKDPQEFDVEYLPSIPDDWCWASMDEATTLITDGEHATPERSNEGIYLLSARNIQNGYLSFEKVDYVSEEVHTKLENRLKVQSGDVFLSCSGTVGRSCVVPEGFQCSLVRSVAVLRPALQMGDFMSLALRSPQLQSQINKKKTQTAQSNLFQGRIRVLALPLAPLAEQIKIVEYIANAFEKIALLEKEYSLIIEQSACLNQSILSKAFRGELVPQDPNDEPADLLLDRIRAEREKLTSKKKIKRSRKKKSTQQLTLDT